MKQKIKLGDSEYLLDDLSVKAKEKVKWLQFSNQRIDELQKTLALLNRAKDSYVDSLKKEILSKKAGWILDE